MGFWNNDDFDAYTSSSAASDFHSSPNPNTTRTVVRSQCRTEEVEPGKFIRKCEKTEEILKHCVGRPDEVVQSTKEYTEEDVSDQMTKGQFSFDSAQNGSSYFPGLRNDIEAIERDIFGGISKFFEAAEDMTNEIFGAVGTPRIFSNDDSSSSSLRNKREYRIEGPVHEEALPKKNSNGEIDLSGLARDV